MANVSQEERTKTVHIPRSLHKRAKIHAVKAGIKLGDLICGSLETALCNKPLQKNIQPLDSAITPEAK